MNALTNVRILFADEDHETLAMFKHITTKIKWEGYYAHNAIEMIDCVNNLLSQNKTLDAVVAEVNYLSGPTLTGITAAREIRKAMPDVPIVFLSSYVTTSIIREEIRRVDAQYVAKPFDVDALFRRLAKMIHWHRMTLGQNSEQTDYILSTPPRIERTLKEIGDKP